jgi:hypothetical protein
MTLIRQFKKNLDIFLILIFLFLVILFIVFKSPGFKGSILDEYLVIFDKKVFPHQYKGELTTVKTVLKDVLNFKNISLVNNDIENIIIDVKYEDYNKIQSDRKKSLKLDRNEQYLISRNEVNAKIRFKDKKFLANIRLKGDRADHWKNNKRFSLMVNLKNSASIDSFQKFAITGHARRAFPQNEAISKTLANIGIITPKFKTFRVNFNGQNWGQMYIEEQFSASFYEKRKLKESPIVKFTNSADGKIPAILASKNYQRDFLQEIFSLQGVYEINTYKEKKFKKDKFNLERIYLLQHLNYYLNKNNLSYNEKRKIINFMNIEKFAKVFAFTSLFHDWHSIDKENIRFYLNPFSLKIEPIPTDFGGQNYYNNYGKYLDFKEFELTVKKLPGYFTILYQNQEFQKYYFEYLNYIIKNLQILKNNLNETCFAESKYCNNSINFKNLKDNYDLIKNNKKQFFEKISNLEIIKKKDIKKIQNKIKQFGSDKIIDKLDNFIFSRLYNDGEIIVDNLFYLPIEIKELRIKNDFNNDCKMIKIFNKKLPAAKSIEFKIKDEKLLNCFKDLSKYELVIKVDNKLKTQVFDLYPPKFKNFFINKKNTSLDLGNINYQIIDNNVIIKAGEYHVQKPIIVQKKNLILNPGTKLLFDKETFIKIKDGDLIINGKENNKVLLEAYKDTWNGIYVINSKKSEIYHTIIKDLDFFSDNYFVTLTGGINFYNSNLYVDKLKILNVIAEDAINLTHSKVDLNRLEIYDTLSDGADLDFCIGVINEFVSENIQGDGLDFSGSNIKIIKGNLTDTIDKAISIGEKSDIYVSETFIKNAEIGIAVKDDSYAKLENNLFISNNIDISMYMKKSYYNKGGTLYIPKKQKNKLKIFKDNLSIINYLN